MAPAVLTKKPPKPRKDDYAKPTSVRLTKAMLKEIDAVTKETNRDSRHETIIDLLAYALDVHYGRTPAAK